MGSVMNEYASTDKCVNPITSIDQCRLAFKELNVDYEDTWIGFSEDLPAGCSYKTKGDARNGKTYLYYNMGKGLYDDTEYNYYLEDFYVEDWTRLCLADQTDYNGASSESSDDPLGASTNNVLIGVTAAAVSSSRDDVRCDRLG